MYVPLKEQRQFAYPNNLSTSSVSKGHAVDGTINSIFLLKNGYSILNGRRGGFNQLRMGKHYELGSFVGGGQEGIQPFSPHSGFATDPEKKKKATDHLFYGTLFCLSQFQAAFLFLLG